LRSYQSQTLQKHLLPLNVHPIAQPGLADSVPWQRPEQRTAKWSRPEAVLGEEETG